MIADLVDGGSNEPAALLDRLIPEHDFRADHSIAIAASGSVVLAAVERVTWGEVPLFRLLFGIRALSGLRRDRPLLDDLVGRGFMRLGETEREVAIGCIGRFWTPGGGLVRLADPSQDFARFDEPGYAKAALAFRVQDRSGETILTTETRVAATDARSRGRFALYWRVVEPFSAITRRSWLRAVRARAEGEGGRPRRPARPARFPVRFAAAARGHRGRGSRG